MRDVIPFRAGDRSAARHPPDVAVAALPLLRTLRETLERAAVFWTDCRTGERKNRWGVPPLFFFDKHAQAEWAAVRPKEPQFPDLSAIYIGARMQTGAKAWTDAQDLVDDALTLLAGSVEVRRVARAIPGLRAAAEALARVQSKCRLLAGILAIPDDVVILAMYPAARAGWRVRLRGVADLAQFHVLLADAVTGSPARGFLPGPRPDGRVVDAYRDAAVDPDAAVATARFQLYRATALRADGTLPPRFRAADQWWWGHESPAAVPVVAGEQVVLLGDPPYPRAWPAGRQFSLVRGELELLEVLSTQAVENWLRVLAPGAVAAEPRTNRRAA
jgi:hypothetical protein